MKVFITLSAVFAVALAGAYQNGGGGYEQGGGYQAANGGGNYGGSSQNGPKQPPIPIIKSDSQLNHDGSYQYEYETGNGIQAAEQGYVKNPELKEGATQVAQGYYQYTGDDGIPISVKYIADENGFQPIGDHLPTPPPIPKEIAESLANHQDDGDDGQYHGEGSNGGGGGGGYPQSQQQYYKY